MSHLLTQVSRRKLNYVVEEALLLIVGCRGGDRHKTNRLREINRGACNEINVKS